MAAWGIARRLYAVDVLTMACVTAVGAGTLAVLARVPAGLEAVGLCAGIALLIPTAAWIRTYLDLPAAGLVHDWMPAIALLPIYRSVVLVAGPANGGRTIDASLIAADRWIFGADPTVWFSAHATPVLTELLQTAYFCFYAIPLIVAAELYVRRDDAGFRRWMFVGGFGFYLSYLGYLALPAIGPRFTLHDITATAGELPGLWLTPTLRAIIDGGGLVPTGVPNAIAAAGTARDAFPSGHAAMTIVSVAWAWRERLWTRWGLTVVGALLLPATVYLRYHYVVDVLAGAVLAGVVIAIGPAVHRWIADRLGTADGDHSTTHRYD